MLFNKEKVAPIEEVSLQLTDKTATAVMSIYRGALQTLELQKNKFIKELIEIDLATPQFKEALDSLSNFDDRYHDFSKGLHIINNTRSLDENRGTGSFTVQIPDSIFNLLREVMAAYMSSIDTTWDDIYHNPLKYSSKEVVNIIDQISLIADARKVLNL